MNPANAAPGRPEPWCPDCDLPFAEGAVLCGGCGESWLSHRTTRISVLALLLGLATSYAVRALGLDVKVNLGNVIVHAVPWYAAAVIVWAVRARKKCPGRDTFRDVRATFADRLNRGLILIVVLYAGYVLWSIAGKKPPANLSGERLYVVLRAPVLLLGLLALLAKMLQDVGMAFFDLRIGNPYGSRDPDEAPSSVEESTQLILQLDRAYAIAVEPRFEATEDRVSLTVPEVQLHGLEGPTMLRLERRGIVDEGALTLDGETYELSGDLDAAGLQVGGDDDDEPVMLEGVGATWWSPAGGRIVREIHGVVTTTDPALASKLFHGFAQPEAPEADAVFPWTLDSATRYVANALREGGTRLEVEIESPGSIRARGVDGAEQILNLHNVWGQIDGAPPEVGRAALDGFVASATESPPVLEREDLTARLHLGHELTVEGAEQELRMASRPVGDDLQVVYMLDGPQNMRMLPAEEAEELERDPDARFALAQANLDRKLPRIRVLGGPIFMVCCDGNYEATLLVLDELWSFLAPLLDGPPLVAVPARDLLIVTGDAGEERRAALRDALPALDELSYAISDGLYLRREDGWLERVEG